MSDVNLPLLEQVVNAVEREAAAGLLHDQTRWVRPAEADVTADGRWQFSQDTPPSCGTAMCLAGWACYLSGYTLTGNTELFTLAYAYPPGFDDHIDTVEIAATNLLGLTAGEAAVLFSELITLDGIKHVAACVADGLDVEKAFVDMPKSEELECMIDELFC